MDNLINGLRETAFYLDKQEEIIDSTIKTLTSDEDKLRSYLLLFLLTKKCQDALSLIGTEVPVIEKRLREELDGVCKQARETLDGAKTHAKWIKDVIDGLGKLCGDTDLNSREMELHDDMVKMEVALQSLISIRNNCPFERLDLDV